MVVLIFERWREKVEVRGCDEAENLIFEAGFGKGGIGSTFLSLLTHCSSKFENQLLACIKFFSCSLERFLIFEFRES